MSTPVLSDFRRNFVTMLTGSAVAQVIPIAASPLLTRLYSPEQFALLGVFLAVTGPLGIAVTARYELAIMLPRDEREAADVFWLVARLVVALSAVLAIAALFLRVPMARALGNLDIAPWLLLVPVSVLLTGVYQGCNYWLNRHGLYSSIATGAVAQQLSAATANVGFRATALAAGGLVSGTLVGQAMGAGVLLTRVIRRSPLPTWPEAGALRVAARRFFQFPLLNLPYSFVGTLANGLTIVALSSSGYIAAAGFLSLARRVMLAPVTLLSASLGQVFFQEAARNLGTPRLTRVLVGLLRPIADLGTPVFLFGAYWAPDLFALLFGERWRVGGVFAAAYSPIAFCFLFTSWPERVFEVAQRQHLALGLQVISDTLGLGLLFGLLHIGVRPERAVLLYSLSYTVYHFVYLLIVFRLASVPLRELAVLGRVIATRGALAALVLGGMHLFVGNVPLRFAASAAALVLYAAARWRRRQVVAEATGGSAIGR